MSEEARLRLAFAGMHPDRSRALVARFGSARSVVGRLESGIIDASDRVVDAVSIAADERLRQLDDLGHRVWFRGSPGYPDHLAALPDAPDVLFTRGNWAAGPAVAIVGTRRCTAYGRRLAGRYGAAIARAGWVAVSGLARGIDGAAHEGTVASAGLGIAVLGCGLDVDYPREHARLADALVAGGGAIVSEYPPGTPPEAWRFPPRNRIISGLSRAVVVVEAGVKGGALITAGAALNQGIPVFVTPGDVTREVSRGCNLLIRDGAHPVLDDADLIAELELVLGPVGSSTSRAVSDAMPADGAPVDAASAEGEVRRDETSSALLPLLRATGGLSIDELAASAGMAIPALLAELSRLEADGMVSSDGATYAAAS